MSNQSENEMQQSPTPEEVRQYVLAELEVTRQVIEDLSDEELDEITGSGNAGSSGGYTRINPPEPQMSPYHRSSAEKQSGFSDAQVMYKLARQDGEGMFSAAITAIKKRGEIRDLRHQTGIVGVSNLLEHIRQKGR